MILPLLMAAVGVGASILGATEASSAAKQQAKAERQGAKKEAANVAKQNDLLKQQAEEASKAAKAAAEAQIAGVTQANAIRDAVVAQLNALNAQTVAAQNQQVAASVSAENSRKQQMNLDSIRQRREVVRNALIASSNAKAGAVASGAGLQGSGVAGGQAQIVNQRNSLLLGIFQNTSIGNAIFEANKSYAIAGGVVNQLEAQAKTVQSQGEAQIADLAGQTDINVAKINASAQDRNAQLQSKLFDLQTSRNNIQTQTNIKVGNAKTQEATANGISQIGSQLTSAGLSLYGSGVKLA